MCPAPIRSGHTLLPTRLWTGLLLGLVLSVVVCLPQPAWAQALPDFGQLKNTLSSLLSPAASAPAVEPPGPKALAPAQGPTGSAAMLFTPNQDALSELKVDRHCVKVEENSDVWGKVAEYGGTLAQQRLQVLLASDFERSQLSEEDRRMLRYLAYTTVWVPASVESAIGQAWATLTSAGDDAQTERTGRPRRQALARLAERLETLRSGIDGFPGRVNLVFDPSLADGAFARIGGLVVVSDRFLGLMDESDAVRDVVFAHELAHLYKRHTIKEFQYQLISSAAGWQMAKKLLGKFSPQPTGGFSFFTEMLGHALSAKQLLDMVRNAQHSYSTDQELESDACAIRWLQAQQVEPRAAWQAFAGVLSFSAKRDDDAVSYEKLHPSPAERSTNIQLALARQSAPPAETQPEPAKPAMAPPAKPAANPAAKPVKPVKAPAKPGSR